MSDQKDRYNELRDRLTSVQNETFAAIKTEMKRIGRVVSADENVENGQEFIDELEFFTYTEPSELGIDTISPEGYVYCYGNMKKPDTFESLVENGEVPFADVLALLEELEGIEA